MKWLLLLCTKKVHFSFNAKMYMQIGAWCYGVTFVTSLSRYFYDWIGKSNTTRINRIYQILEKISDHAISYYKLGTVNYIITKWNNFNINVQINFEEEGKWTLPFLDVLIRRKCKPTVINLFRKHTNNDIYLHWNASAPDARKREALKTLVELAYLVVLLMNSYKRNENIQKKFSMRLITTFSTKQYVIKQILKQIQHEQNQQNANVPAAAITYVTKTNEKRTFVTSTISR